MNRTCKLVVLGDSGVGKTTIIHQYINDEFRADFKATIGADFSSKTIEIGEETIEFNIWDTAGEERFHSVGASFYRGVEAVILVYDITQHETFEHLQKWKDDLYSKSGIPISEEIPMIIFGNKADLEDQRQVAKYEVDQIGNANNIPVMEVSAKNGSNIEEGFKKIAELYLKASENAKKIEASSITLKVNQGQNQNKQCNC